MRARRMGNDVRSKWIMCAYASCEFIVSMVCTSNVSSFNVSIFLHVAINKCHGKTHTERAGKWAAGQGKGRLPAYGNRELSEIKWTDRKWGTWNLKPHRKGKQRDWTRVWRERSVRFKMNPSIFWWCTCASLPSPSLVLCERAISVHSCLCSLLTQRPLTIDSKLVRSSKLHSCRRLQFCNCCSLPCVCESHRQNRSPVPEALLAIRSLAVCWSSESVVVFERHGRVNVTDEIVSRD